MKLIEVAADFGDKGGNGLSEAVEKMTDRNVNIRRLFVQSFAYPHLIERPELFKKSRRTNYVHAVFFYRSCWKVLQVQCNKIVCPATYCGSQDVPVFGMVLHARNEMLIVPHKGVRKRSPHFRLSVSRLFR